MSGLTLVDALLSRLNATVTPSDPASIEMLGAWLDQIAESLIGEVKLLRRIDSEDWGGEPAFDRVVFGLVYAEFERWSHQADAALKRIAWLRQRGRLVAKAEELGDYYGLTLARLQVTQDDEDQADSDIRAGKGFTHEEIRNEVRALVGRASAERDGGSASDASGRNTGRDRVAG